MAKQPNAIAKAITVLFWPDISPGDWAAERRSPFDIALIELLQATSNDHGP